MNKKKTILGFVITIAVLFSGLSVNIFSSQASTSYYSNKKMTIKLKNTNGYKSIRVNKKNVLAGKYVKSKKIVCSREGKYVIQSITKNGQRKTIIIYIDKTKPVINGVKNKAVYTHGISISVKDKYKLASVTLNGNKVGASFDLSAAGNYTLIAKDKAGNKTSVSFTLTYPDSPVTNAPDVTAPNVTVSATPSTSTLDSEDATILQPDVPRAPVSDAPEIPLTITPTTAPTSNTTTTYVPAYTQMSPMTQPPIEGFYPPEPTTDAQSNQENPETQPSSVPETTEFPENGNVMDETETCTHNWSNGTVVRTAKCTSKGLKQYMCTLCGAIKTESIPETGHNYRTILTAKATCQHGNQYSSQCYACGDVEKTWEDGNICNHNYSVKDNKKLCDAATCTTPAYYYYKCSMCNSYGTQKYSSGSKLDHDYSIKDYTYKAADATCTENAKYYLRCSRAGCKSHSSETFEAPNSKLDHDYCIQDDSHLASAGTCTENAKYYYTCSGCNSPSTKTYEKPNTTKDHVFTMQYISGNYLYSPATYTAPAYYYYKCENCPAHGTRTYAYGSKLLDSQPPSLILSVSGHDAYNFNMSRAYSSFSENPTTLILQNDSFATIKLSAYDSQSGLREVKYFITQNDLSLTQIRQAAGMGVGNDINITTNSSAIANLPLQTNGTYNVYAWTTDHANNETWINCKIKLTNTIILSGK